MFIPTQDSCLDMSPTDFERFSLYILQQQTKDLEHLEFEHNVIVERSDGSYQIDGIIRFDVMGVTYVTLVECKHYSGPISREKVQVLYDKIRATGAHKGILISTSNFQSGAIKYATEHGIALIQLTDAETKLETKECFRIIRNRPNLYNVGNPYVAVMQLSANPGISCKYLIHHSDALKEFLLDNNKMR